ncbi:MAG: hypothetical protein WCX90_10640 [Thiohalomonadaceae bacterium]|jgi:hypothetical protein
MIEIKLDNQQVTAATQHINDTLSNTASVYRDIGEYLLVSTKRRFTDKVAARWRGMVANSPVTQARKGQFGNSQPTAHFLGVISRHARF